MRTEPSIFSNIVRIPSSTRNHGGLGHKKNGSAVRVDRGDWRSVRRPLIFPKSPHFPRPCRFHDHSNWSASVHVGNPPTYKARFHWRPLVRRAPPTSSPLC
jgi:hypothetical protein